MVSVAARLSPAPRTTKVHFLVMTSPGTKRTTVLPAPALPAAYFHVVSHDGASSDRLPAVTSPPWMVSASLQ